MRIIVVLCVVFSNLGMELLADCRVPESEAPQEFVSRDAAKNELEKELKRILDDFMKDFSRTLVQRQRSIDTEANYSAITARCSAWGK